MAPGGFQILPKLISALSESRTSQGDPAYLDIRFVPDFSRSEEASPDASMRAGCLCNSFARGHGSSSKASNKGYSECS